MTLRQIQYIVEVERFGSLSNAAKALFISQSTLSFAIKDLEGELGYAIFERTHSGMRPTRRGREFLKKAHDALAAFAELEHQIPGREEEERSLRIASVQSSILSAALHRFLPACDPEGSRFRLHYLGGGTGEVVDLVTGGECELGFIYATDRQYEDWGREFRNRGIAVREICALDVCVVLSEQDPLAERESLSLSELSDYTFVFAGDDGLTGFSNLADYSAINFNLTEHRHYLDVQDTQLVNILLHTPKRFSIGHNCVFPLYGGGLKYLPLKDRQVIHLLALSGEGRTLTPVAEAFLEAVRETACDFC